MRVRRLLVLLLLGAPPVSAHSVSNELALGLYQNSPSAPQGPYVADQLNFRFDLNEDWTLKLGGTYTYNGESPPVQGETYGTSSAQILNAVAGLEWDVTSRVDVYLELSGSPRASQRFGATVAPFEVQVMNTSSNVGALAGVSVVLGGTDFLGAVIGGTLLDVSVGWTILTTQQRVDSAVNPRTGQPVGRSVLEAYCQEFPGAFACKQLKPVLKGGEDSLNQFVLSLAVLQPVGSSTDLGLTASVFVYDQDPLAASFFSSQAGQQWGSLGGGFPLAPQRWSISPTLQQQIGSWTLGPWYQFLQYASDYGQAHIAGLRVSLRLGPWWTLWLSGSAQWDLLNPSPGSGSTGTTLVTSGRLALGFRLRF